MSFLPVDACPHCCLEHLIFQILTQVVIRATSDAKETVRLEPLGDPAPNLVVALEHEFMHVQRRPGTFRVDRVEF